MTQTDLVRARPGALPWRPLMTVLSLALFLGSAAAWIHSLSTVASWSTKIGSNVPSLLSVRGRLHIGVGTGTFPPHVRVQHGWNTSPVNAFATWAPDRGRTFLGFEVYRKTTPPFPTWVTYGVTVPYWFLCLLTAALPTRAIWIALRRWLRQSRGQCPMCGHDLHGERQCDSCGFVSAGTHDASRTNFSAPNWSTQVDAILCPLCDYNLRGLTEPRCPECGYNFTWPEVLDPAQRTHPYLFEQRNAHLVRSFLKTYITSLWPPALWRHLQPGQPISVKRLLVFWLLISLPVTGMATFLGVTGFVARQFVTWALLPLASFLALLIYRTTMRRARLRPAHVLRCVIYSSSWMPVLALLAWLARPWLPPYPLVTSHSPGSEVLHWAIAFWAIFFTLPLTVAYSRYLRIARPFLGILLIQILVLAVCTIDALWR